MSTLDQFSTASAGPTGPVGEIGDTGLVGAIGAQGLQGNQGPQGPQGSQGVVGDAGPIGPQGDTGVQGPTGPTGTEEGPQGPTGPQGSTGSQGSQGTQGIQGIVGDAGPDGAQGSQGPVGDSPQGPYGPDGDQGTQGDTGDTGPKGPAGLAPDPFIATGLVSAIGVSPGTSTAGLDFNTDGTLDKLRSPGGNTSPADEWTSNQFTDIGDLYEIYVSRTGDALTTGEALLDAWQPLTVIRSFRQSVTTGGPQVGANASSTLSIEVRRTDLSASDSGVITLSAEREGIN